MLGARIVPSMPMMRKRRGEEEEGDFAAAACGLLTYLVQCIQCDLIVARCFAIVILGAKPGVRMARLFVTHNTPRAIRLVQWRDESSCLLDGDDGLLVDRKAPFKSMWMTQPIRVVNLSAQLTTIHETKDKLRSHNMLIASRRPWAAYKSL